MAKKVILIILGCLIALCGLGSLCGGGALLGIGGTSGNIESGFHTITTPTAAFVSDSQKVENSNVGSNAGSITIKVDGRNSAKPLFIGVGPTGQVDAYLSGAPYETITNVDLSPFKLTTSAVDGIAQPAAPGDQTFWVAQATGTNPHLSWKVAGGSYELVVMNQDASRSVSLDTRVGIKSPLLGGIGLGFLIGGIVVLLGGIALLIWGIRTRRSGPMVAPAGAYPGGGYPPAGVYPQPGAPYQPGGPYPSGGPPGPYTPGGPAGPPNEPYTPGGPAGTPGSPYSPGGPSGTPSEPYTPGGPAGTPGSPYSPGGPAGTPPTSGPPSPGWPPPDDPTAPPPA